LLEQVQSCSEAQLDVLIQCCAKAKEFDTLSERFVWWGYSRSQFEDIVSVTEVHLARDNFKRNISILPRIIHFNLLSTRL
jgi:hypothetical protein